LLYQVTDEEIKRKLIEEKITFYLGADPTADSLHIGHLLAYLVAKRLMEKGHQPILVIGGGTGLVGDPSFKKSERSLLTIDESLKNAEGITKQVIKILPKAQIVNNYDWISGLNAIEFLRDVGKNFNVTNMMNKDSVKSRIENGISFTEFAYQILQAWDFEYLFKHQNCVLQIGGQDQWGNITAGLDLIRKVHSSEAKAYGLTFPLVTKSDGTKFGKTETGTLWLDKEKTTPYEFYQYWINTADADVIMRLKQFTFLSVEEIEALEVSVANSPERREAQKVLAEKVTETVHGAEELEKAIRVSRALFSGKIKELEVDEIEMGFKGLSSVESNEDLSLIDALIAVELVKSRREAREMLKNNAISVNGEKVQDIEFIVKKEVAFGQKYSILRKGKKRYAMIKHI
jgi:tyrosyl-tRNA synthetase